MNRDTSSRSLLAVMDRWRGLVPTSLLPSTVPLAGSSFSTWPLASNETNAALPFGAKTTPKGIDARGSVMVCTTTRVDGLMTLMLALPLLVTQTLPSGAMATLRGEVPTEISASLVAITASKTLTLSLS